MAQRSVEQLKAEYPDTEWRRKFAAVCDLIEILGDCSIADTYTISDPLNEAVTLTPAGAAVRDRLIRKEKIAPKEAKLMCFLTLGHDELYVDIEKVSLEKLESAVDGEIRANRIRFPFIFGRELYDKYAETFEDERDVLTAEETQRLLGLLPIGVFQYGSYTVGPFGLKASPVGRQIPASRRVPAYHCSMSVCRVIHPVMLETSHTAEINKDREKLAAILKASSEEASEWWMFAADLNGLPSSHYGDRSSAILLPLIGDALELGELRELVADLLDNTQGKMRTALSEVIDVQSATETVSALNRAELLQLTLFAQESHLAASLDRLVYAERIVTPVGEIRRAVVNHGMTSGAFRLRGELSSRGVRFVSADQGFALLRERRLLDRLYLRNDRTDVDELEWQLRGIEIDDLDERLEHFYQNTDPQSALERLVLARRTNMITACEEVGIEDGSEMRDEDLVATVMWKLGFSVSANNDPHFDFWQRHEQVWALTQSSEMGGSGRFLEAAGPYFTTLEGILLDSLAYTSWAMLNDHTSSETPFSYDDDEDRGAGLALMNSIAHSPVGTSMYEEERVDLGNLTGGFSALSRHLAKQATQRAEYERPASEFPEYEGKTEMKAFAFRTTIPFLDLTAPSQDRILDGLQDVTRLLSDGEVNQVRNDYAHYRRNSPDIARVEHALEATRQAVTRIETLGFCRLLFSPTRVIRDPWGRSVHDFRGPRSYEHSFTRPTRYDWMGLPHLDVPAYLMRSASVGEPTEVLRFVRRFKSKYSQMWSAYPVRRRKPRSASPDQPDHQEERSGAVLPS